MYRFDWLHKILKGKHEVENCTALSYEGSVEKWYKCISYKKEINIKNDARYVLLVGFC